MTSLIIKPQHQLRAIVYFFCGFYFITAFLVWYFVHSIGSMMNFLRFNYAIDPEVMSFIEKYLHSFVVILLLALISLSILGLFLWLKVSHRIFGPLVPISRHITELQKGNYASRIQLRENDFMLELKDELNLLAEKLEKK